MRLKHVLKAKIEIRSGPAIDDELTFQAEQVIAISKVIAVPDATTSSNLTV